MPTAAARRHFAQSLPALMDADALAIERFIDAIWAERGLAAASLAAASAVSADVVRSDAGSVSW